MKSIIEGCFKRPGAVILALILIFFSGINAFLSIPKEASPDVEIPVAYVSVAYEGISPSLPALFHRFQQSCFLVQGIYR